MAPKKIPPPAKKIPLTMPELIEKKRDGEKLSDDDIKQFVSATVSGEMQDCQIGELLPIVSSGHIVTLCHRVGYHDKI